MRMMLWLAIYFELFLKGRREPQLNNAIRNSMGFLQIPAEQEKLFECFVDYTRMAHCNEEDMIQEVFSPPKFARLDKDTHNLRDALAIMIAILIGIVLNVYISLEFTFSFRYTNGKAHSFARTYV
jgi:hypothetical protein